MISASEAVYLASSRHLVLQALFISAKGLPKTTEGCWRCEPLSRASPRAPLATPRDLIGASQRVDSSVLDHLINVDNKGSEYFVRRTQPVSVVVRMSKRPPVLIRQHCGDRGCPISTQQSCKEKCNGCSGFGTSASCLACHTNLLRVPTIDTTKTRKHKTNQQNDFIASLVLGHFSISNHIRGLLTVSHQAGLTKCHGAGSLEQAANNVNT